MIKVHRTADPETERYLLHSSDSMLVFASKSNLKTLYESEYYVADGTFDKCPKPFTQLYTIHGFVNGEGKILNLFLT